MAPPLAWMAFARRQRCRDNAYLRQIQPRVHEIFTAPTMVISTAAHPLPSGAPEMGLTHLQRVRFALDRALQPVANFEGFEHRDPGVARELGQWWQGCFDAHM